METRTILEEICGKRVPIGFAKIQIPFTVLKIIAELEFLILQEYVPSHLSMKDMIKNQLEISIQGRYITFAGRRQPLTMENYFHIHRWEVRDLPYALNSEKKLRTIHR